MPSLNDQLGTNLDRLAKLYEKRAEAAILRGIEETKRRGTFADAMRDIAGGDVPYMRSSVSERLANVNVNADEVATVARDAFVGGGKATSKLASPRIGFQFDPTLPDAINAARNFSGRMVQNVTQSTRTVIRNMVVNAFAEGLPPYELAEQIEQVVGLSGPHAQAVRTYRQGLMTGGTHRNTANRMARDYAARLRAYRAKNIARTEMMTAVNEGQQVYWRQARDAGFLPPDARRVWIATVPSERTCPTCRSLNNKTAPFEGPFPGGHMMPPAHPQCRCTTGLTNLEYANV